MDLLGIGVQNLDGSNLMMLKYAKANTHITTNTLLHEHNIAYIHTLLQHIILSLM